MDYNLDLKKPYHQKPQPNRTLVEGPHNTTTPLTLTLPFQGTRLHQSQLSPQNTTKTEKHTDHTGPTATHQASRALAEQLLGDLERRTNAAAAKADALEPRLDAIGAPALKER